MIYQDKRGWIYFVKTGIGGEQFKGYYAKTIADYQSGMRNKTMKNLPWRDTKEDAEADLKEYAIRHGMVLIKEED